MDEIQVTDKRFQSQTPEKEFNAPVASDSNALLMEAIRNKYDPAFIEKMMDLRDREEARNARNAYVSAMARFKAKNPQIYKTKKAGFDHKDGQGRTEYKFAPLPDICKVIDPMLAEEGLKYEWETDQNSGQIIITCVMTHEAGHSEKSKLSAPPDQTGKKNNIQAMGSTISYLERYTLLAVCGLATHEMDDDGKTAEGTIEFIDKEQQKKINALLKQTKSDAVKFLELYGAETVDTLPKHLYKAAYSTLKLKNETIGMREPGQEG